MDTPLPSTHAAIVADPDDDGVDIYLPCADTDEVPEIFIVLCACAVRINSDPEWVKEMLAWFRENGLGHPNTHLN